MQKPSERRKTADDLNEPTKWALSDLAQFRHILREAELGWEKWEKGKAACIVQLRELESDMLKGECPTTPVDVDVADPHSKAAQGKRRLNGSARYPRMQSLHACSSRGH